MDVRKLPELCLSKATDLFFFVQDLNLIFSTCVGTFDLKLMVFFVRWNPGGPGSPESTNSFVVSQPHVLLALPVSFFHQGVK